MAAFAKSPEAQLDAFITKFTPEIAAQVRAILPRMRARLPGALELVYDNYNALAIGFGPSEKASDCIFSIAVYPRWVSLFFFINALDLPDPKKLLQGKGNQARHIVLESPEMLDTPGVKTLMREALRRAPPLDPKQAHRLVIKSISPKQRLRRPTKSTKSAPRARRPS
jgi:hypothetical protein